jgi:hypothetical protein
MKTKTTLRKTPKRYVGVRLPASDAARLEKLANDRFERLSDMARLVIARGLTLEERAR